MWRGVAWVALCTEKKLTENSASLTGCNRLTCKGDGKLFRMKIELNRRVPTTKTEYFEIIGIFPDGFLFSREGVFRQVSVNFLTNESSKVASAGLDPTSFRVTIHYSTSAPHSLYVKLCDSTNFYFLSTCRTE